MRPDTERAVCQVSAIKGVWALDLLCKRALLSTMSLFSTTGAFVTLVVGGAEAATKLLPVCADGKTIWVCDAAFVVVFASGIGPIPQVGRVAFCDTVRVSAKANGAG